LAPNFADRSALLTADAGVDHAELSSYFLFEAFFFARAALSFGLDGRPGNRNLNPSNAETGIIHIKPNFSAPRNRPGSRSSQTRILD
jgi:hypothetical protein